MQKNFGKNAGWREIGGKHIYLKSRWEANYAYFLEWSKQVCLIADWEYEPQTFWFEGIKRGCVSYKPDFKVQHLLGSHHWVEVKGYYDARSKTKIKRFKKYFPNETLIVIDKKWYSKNNRKLSRLIKGWEK